MPDGGKSVAVLGLTFKEGTDDIRGSQAIPLIEKLLAAGYQVKAYDPACSTLSNELASQVLICASAEEALFGAEAIVLATAWQEFLNIDYARVGMFMRRKIIVDARRALDADLMKRLDFEYYRPGDGRLSYETSSTSESQAVHAV